MASYLIEIDDKAINEQIQSILNAQINKSLRIKYRGPDGEISASVDVRPVVHGHWIKSPQEEEFDICSVCDKHDKHRSRANWEHDMIEFIPPFCPNCGCSMVVE